MRHAFKLKIKDGTEEEYERRHRQVFPELLQVFRDAGIRSYSIFRDGTTLFAYMEVDDLPKAMAAIQESEANARWQQYMADLLVPFDTGNLSENLPEVFYFCS
ncbi:MAG: L-rhamnose mutarotase [Firmicutes bacterium]|nr:L-rhamnose mutarotase [Bacillota bacterium]